jgi:hypothetical protein
MAAVPGLADTDNKRKTFRADALQVRKHTPPPNSTRGVTPDDKAQFNAIPFNPALVFPVTSRSSNR